MSLTEQLINKITNFICENKLINKNESILVAISGGSDSTALAYLLNSIKEKIHINKLGLIHYNHKLRGQESDRDEDFCFNLSQKLKLPFFKGSLNEKIKKGISHQKFYREKRYNYFQYILSTQKFDKIATAHTLDDLCETILMRLFSGTSLSGFLGIKPISGNIIHPVLNMTREELEGFLKEIKQDFVLDSSNLTDKYLRNSVRLNIIPQIKKIFPEYNLCMNRFIQSLNRDNDFIEKNVNDIYNKIIENENNNLYFLIDKIKNYHQALIFRIIKKVGDFYNINLTTNNINTIYNNIYQNNKGTKKILLKDNIQIIRQYDRIIFKAQKPDIYTEESQIEINLFEKKIWNKYLFYLDIKDKSEINIKNRNIIFFDENKIKLPIIIRSFKEGDKISLSNDIKSKKLKEIFINYKIPLLDRKNIAIILDQKKVIGFVYKKKDGYLIRTSIETYILENSKRVYCLIVSDFT